MAVDTSSFINGTNWFFLCEVDIFAYKKIFADFVDSSQLMPPKPKLFNLDYKGQTQRGNGPPKIGVCHYLQ